jgi:hypothetical protein
MAIRRQAFLTVPEGFNPKYGHVGSKLGPGGDVYILEHLRKMGKLFFCAEAIVWHFVPKEMTSPKYLTRRAFKDGYTSVDMDQIRSPRNRIGILRTTLANLAFLIKDVWHITVRKIKGNEQEYITQLININSRFGRLKRLFELDVHKTTTQANIR